MQRILMIVADQWRGDSLGCVGHPVVKTPHIDSLARDGVLFARHYSCSVPCGPSRATFLTGVYPQNHRMITNGTPLNRDFTNMALELRKGGFDPVMFGYTDITPDPRERAPADPALKSYEGVLPGFTVGAGLIEDNKPWLSALKRKGYPVRRAGYDIYRPDRSEAEEGLSSQPAIYKAEDSDTAWLTDRVLDHLDMTEGAPFFIQANFIKPHPPFVAPAPYHALYRGSNAIPARIRATDPATEAASHPFADFLLKKWNLSAFLKGIGENDNDPADRPVAELDDEDIRNIRATYYGLMSEVDHQVGRLIQQLKDQNLYDETMIIFTSDHGEQMGDHYMLGKGTYFDASYHIPLIIKGPRGSVCNQRVESFSESVDLLPTTLDVNNLAIPHQCDGHSLLPFLRGETPENWRDFVCHHYDFRDVANRTAEDHFGLHSDQCNLSILRDDHYKLVHFAALPPLLFDMTADPGELNNLAHDPRSHSVLLDYTQRLLSWRMTNEYGALDLMVATPEGLCIGTR